MHLLVNLPSHGDARKVYLIRLENFECHTNGKKTNIVRLYKRARMLVVFELRKLNKKCSPYTGTFPAWFMCELIGVFSTERLICVRVCVNNARISCGGHSTA